MLSEQYSPIAFPIIWLVDSPTLARPFLPHRCFFQFLSFFCLVFVFLVGLIMILKHIMINRTVWVWAPHATTTRGRSFCNASSCFTVPLFSIYFKMKWFISNISFAWDKYPVTGIIFVSQSDCKNLLTQTLCDIYIYNLKMKFLAWKVSK